MQYKVIQISTKEVMHEADNKSDCRTWIAMGDRDGWGDFTIVDSAGNEVEPYFIPGKQRK